MLYGCSGGSGSTERTYATAVGDGTSITRTDENSVVSKNALKNISEEIANILKTNVTSFNKTENFNFSDETSYCDISGMKELSLTTENEKADSTIKYTNCNEDKNKQDGQINLKYLDVNSEGKCPKCLHMKVNSEYTFNDLTLSQDINLESDIVYETNNSIKSIAFIISGNVSYKNENYKLHNIRQTIHY